MLSRFRLKNLAVHDPQQLDQTILIDHEGSTLVTQGRLSKQQVGGLGNRVNIAPDVNYVDHLEQKEGVLCPHHEKHVKFA